MLTLRIFLCNPSFTKGSLNLITKGFLSLRAFMQPGPVLLELLYSRIWISLIFKLPREEYKKKKKKKKKLLLDTKLGEHDAKTLKTQISPHILAMARKYRVWWLYLKKGKNIQYVTSSMQYFPKKFGKLKMVKQPPLGNHIFFKPWGKICESIFQPSKH